MRINKRAYTWHLENTWQIISVHTLSDLVCSFEIAEQAEVIFLQAVCVWYSREQILEKLWPRCYWTAIPIFHLINGLAKSGKN